MRRLSKVIFVAGSILLVATANACASSQPDGADNNSQGDDPAWVQDQASHCWAYDAHAGDGDTIAWTGWCRSGKIAGPGTLTFYEDGRVFERVTGNFSDGLLQDGQVSIVWSDGSKYDGEEQNGHFNGHGTLIAADGARYDGVWDTDKLRAADSSKPQEQPPAKPTEARHDAVVEPPKTPVPSTTDADDAKSTWAFLGAALGNELKTVDGRSLKLEPNENGSLSETLTQPDGAILSTRLVPIGDRLGTVTNGDDEAIATYRVNAGRMEIAFQDGSSAAIAANSSGGITIEMRAPESNPTTTEWYPEGHVFSRADRDLAVKQYADRLAVLVPDQPSADPSPATPKHSRKERTHSHASARHSRSAAATSSHLAMAAAVEKQPHPPATSPLETVSVVPSVVHLIDDPAAPRKNGSECLAVESDGGHWGFRNSCTSDVQFSYCLLNGPDRLTACDAGSVAGSVAPNGFSALVADSSLKDTGASHSFRWVGCMGGAGEVVAKLDRYDPPTGRCIHASDMSADAGPADVSPRRR